jgi:hypothetical protein
MSAPQALADEPFGDDARLRSRSPCRLALCSADGSRVTSGLSRSKDKRRQPAAVVTPPSPLDEREAETPIAAQLPRRGPVSRTSSPTYLKDVLGGSAGHRSRLGDSMGDRSAVLQSVAEADHLVAVVLIAPVGGPRRRWEAVPLLPQAQRVRAYVEYRGCFVDRERGSTLLHRVYRQPGLFL